VSGRDPADLRPGHDQCHAAVRLEWGSAGARALAADVAVVVDVLSFTTTLSVAVERGIEVLPVGWRDGRAAAYAAERDAVLAVGRLESLDRPGTVSLSPAAMAAVEGVTRIVLPSPNGSTIAASLVGHGADVAGGCLRNAAAAGRWLAGRQRAGASVAVLPAGEQWPDGSLRPAVEDLWGAGAVLGALVDAGGTGLSAEARVAERAWRAVRPDLPDALHDCASGRELTALGFAADVDEAARVDVGARVPVLRGRVFR
jgi:2-phosphosulfolactate phosphatase